MTRGFAERQRSSFQDRRMWRLLLARLHPDAGGDQDLFVFAHGLRDRVTGELREIPGPDARGGPEQPFSAWRTTMASWASSNRASLQVSRGGGKDSGWPGGYR